jgi:hypothetical protein
MITHNLIQMSRFCNDLHDDDRIVFCKTDFILPEFERIKTIDKKIILIIANSDYTVNDDILSKCPNNVEHIFATNTTCVNDKVTPIPIGVEIEELTTRPGHGMINPDIFEKKPYLLGEIKPSKTNIINKIYSNFNVSTNRNIRTPLKEFCKLNENYYVDGGLTYDEFVNQVSSHIATLSPRGNGIECIRTYEVLYLNSIPIVFGDNKEYQAINEKIYKNLPVVFLHTYNQLNDFSYIEKRISEVKNNSKESLDYYYWVDLIKKRAHNI